jgi:hypothetical protein
MAAPLPLLVTVRLPNIPHALLYQAPVDAMAL